MFICTSSPILGKVSQNFTANLFSRGRSALNTEPVLEFLPLRSTQLNIYVLDKVRCLRGGVCLPVGGRLESMADGILEQREPPQERLPRSATQHRNTVMSSEALATGVPMQSPENSRVFSARLLQVRWISSAQPEPLTFCGAILWSS